MERAGERWRAGPEMELSEPANAGARGRKWSEAGERWRAGSDQPAHERLLIAVAIVACEPGLEQRAAVGREDVADDARHLIVGILWQSCTQPGAAIGRSGQPVDFTVSTAASIAAPSHITHGSSVDTRIASRAAGSSEPAAARNASISPCKAVRSPVPIEPVPAAGEDLAVTASDHGADRNLAGREAFTRWPRARVASARRVRPHRGARRRARRGGASPRAAP